MSADVLKGRGGCVSRCVEREGRVCLQMCLWQSTESSRKLPKEAVCNDGSNDW